MHFQSTSSPHLGSDNSVRKMMYQVIYALIPGTIATIWYFGWGVLISLVLAITFALFFEAVILALRKRPLTPLFDGSAIVTAWLLSLAMPPAMSWWMIFTGMFFAIVIAKQLYGGLGYNPFNPAMAAYVMLLVSFPGNMTSWLPPASLAEHHLGFVEMLRIIFTGQPPVNLSWDAITMATPLDTMKTSISLDLTVSETLESPLFGVFSGVGWEWIRNWFALGGIWLLYKKIIPWQIPVGVILGLGIPATIFSISNEDVFTTPMFHIFSGAAILGAFFIATDPVSGSTTPKGRLIFGFGVGFLTYIIRTWGGYPDGIAFAVLLMNMSAPMIDYYTQPRVFGKDQHHE